MNIEKFLQRRWSNYNAAHQDGTNLRKDKALDPIEVRLLGADAIMRPTKLLSDLIQ